LQNTSSASAASSFEIFINKTYKFKSISNFMENKGKKNKQTREIKESNYTTKIIWIYF